MSTPSLTFFGYEKCLGFPLFFFSKKLQTSHFVRPYLPASLLQQSDGDAHPQPQKHQHDHDDDLDHTQRDHCGTKQTFVCFRASLRLFRRGRESAGRRTEDEPRLAELEVDAEVGVEADVRDGDVGARLAAQRGVLPVAVPDT